MRMWGLMMIGTAVAAVSQAEWDRFADNIRDGFRHINEKAEELSRSQSRMELWQREHTGSHELIAFRLNQLTDEQTRFINEARSNHAILAPKMVDKDGGSARGPLLVGLAALVTALYGLGKGVALAWAWTLEHFRKP